MNGELLRGYLLTQDALEHDVDFSLKQLLLTTNDMADVYGNLLSRSLGASLAKSVVDSKAKFDVSDETRNRMGELGESVKKEFDSLLFGSGFRLILNELHRVGEWKGLIPRPMHSLMKSIRGH